ncbi:MAG: nickel pincer cofactor biosynthesis protein LarC [Lachnospiraceae bacterium]|nr:nickel pincer cofactor biosynthesis protein LarC [Lachnospiraceae bacterium]
MKTLYLDCGMGAAGDMLTAALIELLPNPDEFIEKLNTLSIPGVQIKKETAVKCGITGTHISVTVHGVGESEEMYGHHNKHEHNHGHEHEHKHNHAHDTHQHEHNHAHHHSSMHEIEHIISDLKLPKKVQEDVLAVYGLIAEAESHAHGVPVTEIHFHEVGTMDAVADVTAVCLLMNELSPDEVVVSPVHVGSGHVKCAHGVLPVPAPATAHILKDVPIYGGDIKGELCTPTGAALLKHFATRFGAMPVMKTQAIGYGMGKKDFETANCVRAMLGETADKTDVMLELSCNVDDMTAEAIGFATERLFEGGAHEVYTIPIGMKKSRPGTLIRVICKEQDKENILHLLFQHTTTIGVREAVTHRYVLNRSMETVQTPYGEVRRKISSGYGVLRMKYEYDDLSRIAKEQNISLDEVKKRLESDGTI